MNVRLSKLNIWRSGNVSLTYRLNHGFCIRPISRNSTDYKIENLLGKYIKQKGPITVAEFMSLCLSNPKFGYYSIANPFGNSGDFVTSPEISQIFGELIAIWITSEFKTREIDQSELTLVELGPGTGLLMSDILNVLNKLNDTKDIVKHIFLVETSKKLQKQQQEKLSKHDVNFIEDVRQLPKSLKNPYFIANEFFDAMPIHIFKKVDSQWKEILVDYQYIDSENSYHFVEHNTNLSSKVNNSKSTFQDMPNGSTIEISFKSLEIFQHICNIVKTSKSGGILAIDYGPIDSTPSNSLRSIYKHTINDPLHLIGKSDITADVDFSNLVKVAINCKLKPHGPITQNQFLTYMGIYERLSSLTNKFNDKEQLTKAVERLVNLNINGMGRVYKVLAVNRADSCTAFFEDNS